jgi:hypothetical protein
MLNVRSLALVSFLALTLFAGCAAEEDDATFAEDESALQNLDGDPGDDSIDIEGTGPVAEAQRVNAFVDSAGGTVFGSATVTDPNDDLLSFCVKIVRDGRLDDGAFHCTGSRLGNGSTTMSAPQLHCGASDGRNHRYKTRIEMHFRGNGIAFGESRAITLRRVCR